MQDRKEDERLGSTEMEASLVLPLLGQGWDSRQGGLTSWPVNVGECRVVQNTGARHSLAKGGGEPAWKGGPDTSVVRMWGILIAPKERPRGHARTNRGSCRRSERVRGIALSSLLPESERATGWRPHKFTCI